MVVFYKSNYLGQKVEETVRDNATITTTNYQGMFHYENNILKFFATAEGYVNVTIGRGSSRDDFSYAFNYVYNYTDHLGNIRLSYTKGTGTNPPVIMEENHYYPFGLKHKKYGSVDKDLVCVNEDCYEIGIDVVPPQARKTYQYKYNGKEFQDELGLNWYNYGWRNYDPAIARWVTVDPLAEVQPNKTPYHFVSNNPINRIDPTGMLDNPIYDTDGNFLGTDDKGLQGKAIVMNKENFTQGMSHEYALSHSLGAEGLNEDGLDKLLTHKSTLSSRVDWKGYVTFGEAIDHYHYGNGEPLYVDISKINFKSSRLSVDDFTSRGTNSLSVNFFMTDTHPFYSNILWYPGESNLGNVFGTLRVNLESTNGSISLQNYERYGGGFDRFDFNRADQFIADRLRRGGNPTPYNFYGYGKGSINLTKPKVHTLDNPGIKKPGEF